MAETPGEGKRGFSRREFLTLAGAGAVFGAIVLTLTHGKGVSGLLRVTQNAPAKTQTAGRVVRTPTQVSSSSSFLAKLFGGKL